MKLHKITMTLLAAGFLTASTSGFAQGTSADNGLARGWYLTGAIGQSKSNLNGGGVDATLAGQRITSSTSLKTTDTSWKVQLGYQFTRNWGMEGGYIDLGRVTGTSTVTAPVAGTAAFKNANSGWNVAGVGTLPLGNNFDLSLHLGVIRWQVNPTLANGTGGTMGTRGVGNDADWGLGFKYNFTRSTALRLDWDRLTSIGNQNTGGAQDINLYSAGLQVNFQ